MNDNENGIQPRPPAPQREQRGDRHGEAPASPFEPKKEDITRIVWTNVLFWLAAGFLIGGLLPTSLLAFLIHNASLEIASKMLVAAVIFAPVSAIIGFLIGLRHGIKDRTTPFARKQAGREEHDFLCRGFTPSDMERTPPRVRKAKFSFVFQTMTSIVLGSFVGMTLFVYFFYLIEEPRRLYFASKDQGPLTAAMLAGGSIGAVLGIVAGPWLLHGRRKELFWPLLLGGLLGLLATILNSQLIPFLGPFASVGTVRRMFYLRMGLFLLPLIGTGIGGVIGFRRLVSKKKRTLDRAPV